MATNTTNFNLSKPAYTDTADIAVINSNMDKVDASLQGLGAGIAIISKANTHGAITAGQYVYVHGHSTLAEGMYIAKSNISANATLSTSNLQATSGGALNLLNANKNNNLSYVFRDDTLITTQVDNMDSNASVVGYVGSYGHQEETGVPTDAAYYIDVHKASANYALIEATSVSGFTNVFRKYKVNGVWGEWLQVVYTRFHKGSSIVNIPFNGAYGFITNSAKSLYISVPINLGSEINSMTVTGLKLGLRAASGGYVGGADQFDVSNDTSYPKSVTASTYQGIMDIAVTNNNGWNLPNNSTFSGRIVLTGTFT